MTLPPISVLDLASVRSGWSTHDAFAASIRLAEAADGAGAARFWVAEHHNMVSVAATTPPVLMAALGAHTRRLRVGSGGVMLPNHSPYVVAEQFAALEALYPGRVDLGIGRAPGADAVTAWALRRSQEGLGHEDFVEHLQLLRAWLSPSGVSAGPGTTLRATPEASGYPEMWLLGSSDYSARLAGQLGLRYAYAGHFGRLDPADVFDLYRRSFQPSAELAAPHTMLATTALIGDSAEEARFLAGPSTINWINIRRDTREPLCSPEEAARRLEAMGHPEVNGTKVVGTADHVREQLGALVQRCGAQELMVLTTAWDVQTRITTVKGLLAP